MIFLLDSKPSVLGNKDHFRKSQGTKGKQKNYVAAPPFETIFDYLIKFLNILRFVSSLKT